MAASNWVKFAPKAARLTHSVNPHTKEKRLLLLKPNCECCNKDLIPESTDARICSFECTFCVTCAETVVDGKCPNCGGELVTRPRRPVDKPVKYPELLMKGVHQWQEIVGVDVGNTI